MHTTPKWTEFASYPVVALTAGLSLFVTATWSFGADISGLFESAAISRGELWRLVTSILPHGGWMHLAFNLYWLWMFGTIVERRFGHFRALILIVIFAAGSGAWEYALFSGGIGLSGVVYGLFGVLWALARKDARYAHLIDERTIQVFVGWFFLCIVTTVTKISAVANVAHGIGALLGVLTGCAVADLQRRRLATAALVAIVLSGVGAATLARPTINLSSDAGEEECWAGHEASQANRSEEAVWWLRRAARYRSMSAGCWYGLAMGELKVGRPSAAIAAFQKAGHQGDTNAQTVLARAYSDGEYGLSKNEAQALFWYHKAADSGHAFAQNNLAYLYLEAADSSIRDPGAALEYAKKAVGSEGGASEPDFVDTLAEAYYANRDYVNAVKTQEQALSLAEADQRDAFEARLKKYRCALKGSSCP